MNGKNELTIEKALEDTIEIWEFIRDQCLGRIGTGHATEDIKSTLKRTAGTEIGYGFTDSYCPCCAYVNERSGETCQLCPVWGESKPCYGNGMEFTRWMWARTWLETAKHANAIVKKAKAKLARNRVCAL